MAHLAAESERGKKERKNTGENRQREKERDTHASYVFFTRNIFFLVCLIGCVVFEYLKKCQLIFPEAQFVRVKLVIKKSSTKQNPAKKKEISKGK